MFTVSFGKSEGSFATQSGSDGVADLNPDDIESINMLNGPSAAALYGNAAAIGVVLINTKKGSAEKKTLTVSNNTMFSDAYIMPEMQTGMEIIRENLQAGAIKPDRVMILPVSLIPE